MLWFSVKMIFGWFWLAKRVGLARSTNPGLQHFGKLFDVLCHLLDLFPILLVLFAELLVLFGFWVDIFTGSVVNKRCHAGIGESLEGFLEMQRSRVQTSYLRCKILRIPLSSKCCPRYSASADWSAWSPGRGCACWNSRPGRYRIERL